MLMRPGDETGIVAVNGEAFPVCSRCFGDKRVTKAIIDRKTPNAKRETTKSKRKRKKRKRRDKRR